MTIASITSILAWASFGIAYSLTKKVEKQLERYNNNALHNGFILETTRGSATWILLAGAVSLIQIQISYADAGRSS
jgi:hypothetical protein